MMSFKFIELFSGIGGIRLGFEHHGGQCVFSSEIDPAAQKTYQHNFSEISYGDITKISPASISDHDILLGGFPYWVFSICGKQEGFADTRGALFFKTEEILSIKQQNPMLLC